MSNKKMKKSIIGIIFLIVVVTACKKDSASGQSGSVLPPYNYPYNADIIMNVGINKSRASGFEGAIRNALAYFLPETGQLQPLLLIDSLFLNSEKFSLNGDTGYYLSVVATGSPSPAWLWSLYSSTRFGSFQVTMVRPPSDFSSTNLASSDTIHRASGFTFNHPLVKADSVFYIISDASSNLVFKKQIGNASGIQFTSAELSFLQNTSNGGNFEIQAYSDSRIVVNGNLIYFHNFAFARNNTVAIKN